MCGRHPVVPGRRVDFAARPANDFAILEVADQRRVIGVKQPRTADQCERNDVLIIRHADMLVTEFVRARLHIRIRHASCSAKSDCDSEPPHESLVPAQLPPKSAADHQLPTWILQPVEEVFARRGSIMTEHFVRHVGIDDPAHQRPTERRTSSMKNCP